MAAGTGLTRSAADAVLKEFYIGPLRKQLNTASPFLAELERDTEHFEGRQVVIPVHVGRSEGIGARSDSGDATLPGARNQKYTTSTFKATYQYGRIQITLPTIKSAASDKGSFIRAVESETQGIMTEMKEDFDRQLVKNDELGRGVLAPCASNAANVITLGTTDVSQARALRIGMIVDIVDNTDDSLDVTDREITAMTFNADGSPATITVDGATIGAGVVTASHRVARTGNWKNELQGMAGIVSDSGTLQGISPTTYPVWKSSVVAAGGTVTENLMQKVIDSVSIAGGEEPDAILTEHTQRRKFYGLLQGMKRAVNTLELKGGFKTLTFNDSIPLILSRFAKPSEMIFYSRKHLKLYEMADWDWADDDGAVLSRVSGKPAYEAFLYKFCQLATDKRNAHGILTGLTTTD